MADNKSSLVQIAQAVLDEATQSVKVAISVDGSPVDATNPMPVVIDSQSIVVEVALDKDNDSVTAWQGGGAWSVTNTHITEAVATEAKQDSQITELQAIKGYVDGIESKLDTLNSQTDGVEATLLDVKSNTTKLDYVNRVRLAYSATNVTTGAWIELLASVGAVAVKEIEIFDSSGETLELGVGAAASEVSKSFVVPGGNGRIPMQIAAGTRLAIKAVSATANSGEIVINLYG